MTRKAGQGKRAAKPSNRNARRNAQTRSRKATLERRRTALRNACEGLLVARGWRISEAAQLALWWVTDALKWARRIMEKYGFDYMSSTWRMT